MSLLPVSEEPVWGPRRPVVTYALVLINVGVYVLTSWNSFFLNTGNYWVDKYALIPVLLLDPAQLYRLLSSMFLHANFLHILFNMYFLYFFGKDVEEAVGGLKFGVLYFISGLAATAFHTAFIPIMGLGNLLIPALGASGAISGVLGAYLLLYPNRRLTTCWFMWIFPFCFTMSAAGFLIFWFALQIIYGFGSLGTVAFFAHAGGFVTGLALLKLMGASRYYFMKNYPHFFQNPYGYFPHYLTHPRSYMRLPGLGKWVKVTLGVLLAILIGGAAYSAVYAANTSQGLYMYDVSAGYHSVGEERGIGAYSPGSGLVLTPDEEAPRIVLNRLYWSGLLQGPPSKTIGNYIMDKELVPPIASIPIHVRLKASLTYDGRGVLIKSQGDMVTDVLVTNPYTNEVGVIKDRLIHYRLELVKGATNATFNLILPSAVTALLLTLLGLIAVIKTPTEQSYMPSKGWGLGYTLPI